MGEESNSCTAYSFCLVGFVSKSIEHSWNDYDNYKKALYVLRKLKPERISIFNDAKSTTHKDVLEVLDKAIETLKE